MRYNLATTILWRKTVSANLSTMRLYVIYMLFMVTRWAHVLAIFRYFELISGFVQKFGIFVAPKWHKFGKSLKRDWFCNLLVPPNMTFFLVWLKITYGCLHKMRKKVSKSLIFDQKQRNALRQKKQLWLQKTFVEHKSLLIWKQNMSKIQEKL